MRRSSRISGSLLFLILLFAAGVSRAQGTDPDLAEELPDVSLSQPIRDQATALGNDPVRIYEFVRNECEYQVYYGLMKGPEATLRSRAGNDYDLSALLVSLLRSAGIKARFVRGRIAVTGLAAQAWTGATTGFAAKEYWARSEPPGWSNVAGVGAEYIGGEARRLHIWVEAFVSLSRYRGAGASPGALTWVPLDPAYKLVGWNAAPGLLSGGALVVRLLRIFRHD